MKIRSPSRRGRPQSVQELQQLYSSKIPISQAKHKDLKSLCTSGVIPEEFHYFYQNLHADPNEKDSLPQPDCTESDTE